MAAAIVAIVVIASATAGNQDESGTETASSRIESAALPAIDDQAEANGQGLMGATDETTTSSTSPTTTTSTTAVPSTATTTVAPTTAAPTTGAPTTATPTTVTTRPATSTAPPTTAVVTTTEAPTTTSVDCHPAYVECIPNYPGDALNCGDLSASVKPVRVRDPSWDPYGLDGDNDGVGCEAG